MGRKERDLGIFLVISVLFFTIFIGTALRNTSDAIPGGNIRPSMNHPTIYLDGNAALDAFPDKTGSGNATDPYLIQGLNIDTNGNASCIFLNNTDKFLKIKECNLSNHEYGIHIVNCKNIEIIDCNIENNWDGIYIFNSNYINITRNHIERNVVGCKIIVAYDVVIQENRICNNDGTGLLLFGGRNTIIIFFTTSSDEFNFKIIGNTISYNKYTGIYLSSNDNIIYNNDISYNNGYGMEVYGNSNEIYQNTFILNEDGCIHEYFDMYNSIHDNECINPPGWYLLYWFLPVFLAFIIGMLITVAIKQKKVIIPKLLTPIDVPFMDRGWGQKYGKKLQGYIPFLAIMFMTTLNYFFAIEVFKSTSLYYIITEMSAILILNIFLGILTFYMSRKALTKLVAFSMIIGIILGLFSTTTEFQDIGFHYFHMWEYSTFVVLSIILPGMSMLIMGSLKQVLLNKTRVRRLSKKIRVHESLLGLIFFLIAMILQVPREVSRFLGIYDQLFLYMDAMIDYISIFFLFIGAFSLSRDWHDFTHGKFIRKRAEKKREENSSDIILEFDIREDQFFNRVNRSPRMLLLLIGSSISFSFMAHAHHILPPSIFQIGLYDTIIFGFAGAVAFGGLIGYMEAHVKPYQYFLFPPCSRT